MKEDLNKFDDALKKGLEGQEFEPSADLWANISKGVDAAGGVGSSSAAGGTASGASGGATTGGIAKFTAMWKTLAIVASVTVAVGTAVVVSDSSEDLSNVNDKSSAQIAESVNSSKNQDLNNNKNINEEITAFDTDTTEMFDFKRSSSDNKSLDNSIKSGEVNSSNEFSTSSVNTTSPSEVEQSIKESKDVSKQNKSQAKQDQKRGNKEMKARGVDKKQMNNDALTNIFSETNKGSNEIGLGEGLTTKESKINNPVQVDENKSPEVGSSLGGKSSTSEKETNTLNNGSGKSNHDNSNVIEGKNEFGGQSKNIVDKNPEISTSIEDVENMSLSSISVIDGDYVLTEQKFQSVVVDTTLVTENEKSKNRFLFKTPWEPIGMYFEIGTGMYNIHQNYELRTDGGGEFSNAEFDEYSPSYSLHAKIGYQHKSGFFFGSGFGWYDFQLNSINKILVVEDDYPLNDYGINSFASKPFPVDALDYFTYEWDPDVGDWEWNYEEPIAEIDLVIVDWVDIYSIPLTLGYRHNMGRLSLYGSHSLEYNRVTYWEREYYFQEYKHENYMGKYKTYNGEKYISSKVELGVGFKLSSQLEVKGSLMARSYYSSFTKMESIRSPKFLGSNISLRFTF